LSKSPGSAKGVIVIGQKQLEKLHYPQADALEVELTEAYRDLRADYVQSLMVGKQLLRELP